MYTVALTNEKELLQLLTQDDRIAFEEIYHHYWAHLFDSAYKRLKDVAQCKDIVQDVFADLWIRRGKVDIANLGAYLEAAVRFQVFKTASRYNVTSHFVELFESIAASPFNADNSLNEKELEELAQDWLESMPEKRKEIFYMYFRDDLTTKEIARRMHISRKTVQNQLGTATRYIRDQLIFSVLLLTGIVELLKSYIA